MIVDVKWFHVSVSALLDLKLTYGTTFELNRKWKAHSDIEMNPHITKSGSFNSLMVDIVASKCSESYYISMDTMELSTYSRRIEDPLKSMHMH